MILFGEALDALGLLKVALAVQPMGLAVGLRSL
jgi:hypothetical protein